MTSLSVLIPVYKNAETLEPLYTRLSAALEDNYSDFELFLVDDGSPDKSWEVIEKLAAADHRIKGVRLSRNFGQHPAITAALDRATGAKIILMDADLEDRPETLPGLLDALREPVDIVYTVKQQTYVNAFSRLTSMIFHQTFSFVSSVKVPADVGTLRVFNRKVLEALKTYKEYNVLYGPLMFYVGFTSVFVPVERDNRPIGISSYTFYKRFALAVRSLVSYTNLPHTALFFGGFLSLTLTLLFSCITIAQYLIFGVSLPRGLTLILIMVSFSFSVTTIGLGIIGSYIFRVFQEVLGRPRYIVAEDINVERKA